MAEHRVYFMTAAERVALQTVVVATHVQGYDPPASNKSNERAWYRAHDAAARVFAPCHCSAEDMEAQEAAAAHMSEQVPESPVGECSICWPTAVEAAGEALMDWEKE